MIKTIAEKYKEELIKIRRDLHKIPEIGRCEYKTAEYIRTKLNELGISYKTSFNTGTVAYINPEKTSKTILLRADIDALPQTEQTELEFASEHKGMMHACGHDFHITCLLGAAKILNDLKEDIDGHVVLVFQPDEENEGGALPMIEEGILDGVDAAIALHIEPLLKTGFIQIRDGSIMASPDDYVIKIKGKSGHGACPENCINPISIASEIVEEFHMVSKNIKDCVVTVCTFNSGTDSPNIIPDTAVLTGTARTISPQTRDKVELTLKEILEKICIKYGAEYEFKFYRRYPPLINDKKMNELVKISADKLGIKTEILDKCSMTGEDFAYFAERVPASFFKLGTGNEKLGMYPLHNSKLNPDEDALVLGAEILSQTAINYIRG